MQESGNWIKHGSEEGPDLILFKVRFDEMENPRNGKRMRTVVLEANNSVNLVAVDKFGKIILVRQLRFGTGKMSLEVPGGFIDKGEDPLTAAKRELLEETGYGNGEWSFQGKIAANAVYLDAYVTHFLARNVEKVKETNLDEGEDIEVIKMLPEEVVKAVEREEINHPHSLSALSRVINLWNPQI